MELLAISFDIRSLQWQPFFLFDSGADAAAEAASEGDGAATAAASAAAGEEASSVVAVAAAAATTAAADAALLEGLTVLLHRSLAISIDSRRAWNVLTDDNLNFLAQHFHWHQHQHGPQVRAVRAEPRRSFFKRFHSIIRFWVYTIATVLACFKKRNSYLKG